jgi:putative two-component system response regulator
VSKDAGLQAQRVLAVDLELGMARRTDILLRSQDAMIGALAVLAETRDGDTGAHVSRTSRITALLCQELQNAGMPGMDEDRVFFYGATSALHDIGKVGVPDAVLLKEGPLDPSELKAMRRHVEIGESVVNSISFGPGESPYFQCALEIIGGHHERWDGRGYPRGLAGPEIPLGGRIVAVADVYDAIRSKRPYKGEKSHEEAVEYIRDNGGRHFDPLVSQAFLRIAGQVAQVYSEPETGG